MNYIYLKLFQIVHKTLFTVVKRQYTHFCVLIHLSFLWGFFLTRLVCCFQLPVIQY